MDLISGQEMADYKALIKDAFDTFGDKPITWRRVVSTNDRWKEGKKSTVDIPLRGLCNYNYNRSWPLTQGTDTGEKDRESVQVLFLKEYLKGLGYINANNYWDFDPALDRFIMDGLTYKANGDSAASLAEGDDLWIFIVMDREETLTGDKR